MQQHVVREQVIPISLTLVVCAVLIVTYALLIRLLNLFTPTDIVLHVRWLDVLIGLTIYLKTSIDFAIYIGNLMDRNPGWRARVAIEIGTAVGNAAGTMAILAVWTFFKEVKWLLVLMIGLAALVLFRLAEDSLEHAKTQDDRYPAWFRRTVDTFEWMLDRTNKLLAPLLRYIIPNLRMRGKTAAGFWSLFGLAFSVPFILGLDDFAGYVPLFSVVNVFGFGIGVFVGHMILNLLLYLSPARTIRAVKNPIIALIGSFAFVALGVWGLVEVVRIIGH